MMISVSAVEGGRHGIFMMQAQERSIQSSHLLNCQRSRLGRVKVYEEVSCSKHFRQIFLAPLDKLKLISEAITLDSVELKDKYI